MVRWTSQTPPPQNPSAFIWRAKYPGNCWNMTGPSNPSNLGSWRPGKALLATPPFHRPSPRHRHSRAPVNRRRAAFRSAGAAEPAMPCWHTSVEPVEGTPSVGNRDPAGGLDLGFGSVNSPSKRWKKRQTWRAFGLTPLNHWWTRNLMGFGLAKRIQAKIDRSQHRR